MYIYYEAFKIRDLSAPSNMEVQAGYLAESFLEVSAKLSKVCSTRFVGWLAWCQGAMLENEENHVWFIHRVQYYLHPLTTYCMEYFLFCI